MKKAVQEDSLGISPKDRATEWIRWFIDEHDLVGGDRLPPERELCEMVGVSRTALRGAIVQLVSEHVLESRQGSGTYVCPPKPVNIFQETYNFSEAVRNVGLTPSSKLVYVRMSDATGDLADSIGLPQGSPLFEIRRVRLADGVPAAIETAYVNYAICPGIERHNFESESLYDVLFEEYGVRVEHGSERISITRLNAEEAELLEVSEGMPVFFERSVEFTDSYVPVEYAKAVIIPSRLRFASNGAANGSHAEVGNKWLMS